MSERDSLDRYYTPDKVAGKLVAAIPDLGTRVPPLTILEPSCGAGAFLRAIGARWHDARLTGIDADIAAIDAALAPGVAPGQLGLFGGGR